MMEHIPAKMLLDSTVLDTPYPFYRQLQQNAPVWQVPGTDIFIVTRYDLVEEATRRVDDFSSNLTSVLYRKSNGLPGRVSHRRGVLQVLATADPPIHSRHKTAVASHFSARQITALKSEIERVARVYICKALTKDKTDFMEDIGNPLPMQIVSDLVGFKASNLKSLLQAAFDSTAVVSGSSSILKLGWCMLRSYFIYRWVGGQLRTVSPDSQTILGSIKRSVTGGDLREAEARAFLLLFLAAGGESTTSLLGSAVGIIAADQSLQQTLRDRPDLIPAFIEEVLRLESPFRFHLRSTPKETFLGDLTLPADATILLFWGAANRDPAIFENPNEIDLTRPKKHLSFGRGIHTCIGAPLARLEAQVVLEELLNSTSNIVLDPNNSPRWVSSLQVRRYQKLPLILTPYKSSSG